MEPIAPIALAAVCGGADANDLRATACNGLVRSLYAGDQHVPSFAAACGDLHPKIQEGGRVVKNVFDRFETR